MEEGRVSSTLIPRDSDSWLRTIVFHVGLSSSYFRYCNLFFGGSAVIYEGRRKIPENSHEGTRTSHEIPIEVMGVLCTGNSHAWELVLTGCMLSPDKQGKSYQNVISAISP